MIAVNISDNWPTEKFNACERFHRFWVILIKLRRGFGKVKMKEEEEVRMDPKEHLALAKAISGEDKSLVTPGWNRGNDQ